MGNQTSQCFALLYLDEVDRFVKEQMRIKHYLRYMDDMVMIVEDKRTAACVLAGIESGLTENRL